MNNPLTTDYIENIVSNIIVKHFWHSDHKIFDVEFYYKDELLVMFSYPKKNQWRQNGNMMRSWQPIFYVDNTEEYIRKEELLNLLISKLKDISENIWNIFSKL
jgi:hypothetical protein